MAKWALDRCDPDEDEEAEAHMEQLEDILAGIEEKLPNESKDKAEYLRLKSGEKEEEQVESLLEEMMAEVNEDLERAEIEGDDYYRKKYHT
jgi:arginyl-tRNA synthetase